MQKVGITDLGHRVRQSSGGYGPLALHSVLFSTSIVNLKEHFLGHVFSPSRAYTASGEWAGLQGGWEESC